MTSTTPPSIIEHATRSSSCCAASVCPLTRRTQATMLMADRRWSQCSGVSPPRRAWANANALSSSASRRPNPRVAISAATSGDESGTMK